MQLYFKESGLPYGQGNAIRQSVPKGGNQQVTFIIPPSGGVPQNLRFDFASVPLQEVTIHSMELSKGEAEVRIPSNELLEYFNSPEKWNVVLDKDSAKFGVKEINQFVDVQLTGNHKLDSLIKQILKSNREKNS